MNTTDWNIMNATDWNIMNATDFGQIECVSSHAERRKYCDETDDQFQLLHRANNYKVLE